MMRRAATVAGRAASSPRSLLVQSNASAGPSILRSLTLKNTQQPAGPPARRWTVGRVLLRGAGLAVKGTVALGACWIANFAYTMWPDKWCEREYSALPRTLSASVLRDSSKAAELFEVRPHLLPLLNQKVETAMFRSIWEEDSGTQVRVYSDVYYDLPDVTLASDYEKVFDGLKPHGIHVENSERGARRGLSAYALKFMQKNNEFHIQSECNCGLCSVPVELPEEKHEASTSIEEACLF